MLVLRSIPEFSNCAEKCFLSGCLKPAFTYISTQFHSCKINSSVTSKLKPRPSECRTIPLVPPRPCFVSPPIPAAFQGEWSTYADVEAVGAGGVHRVLLEWVRNTGPGRCPNLPKGTCLSAGPLGISRYPQRVLSQLLLAGQHLSLCTDLPQSSPALRVASFCHHPLKSVGSLADLDSVLSYRRRAA